VIFIPKDFDLIHTKFKYQLAYLNEKPIPKVRTTRIESDFLT
jgi:hypothetical protein